MKKTTISNFQQQKLTAKAGNSPPGDEPLNADDAKPVGCCNIYHTKRINKNRVKK